MTALFPDPQTDASRRLAELAGRLDQLRREARDLRAAAANRETGRAAAAATLRQAEARQYALGEGAAQVAAARRDLTRLEKQVTEHNDRARLVTDAVGQVEQEHARHAREHATALHAELRDSSLRAAAQLHAAITTFTQAHALYVESGVRADSLMRLTNPERARTERIPDLPPAVTDFARHAKTIRSVPVPVPTHPGHATAATTPPGGGVVDLAGLTDPTSTRGAS